MSATRDPPRAPIRHSMMTLIMKRGDDLGNDGLSQVFMGLERRYTTKPFPGTLNWNNSKLPWLTVSCSLRVGSRGCCVVKV